MKRLEHNTDRRSKAIQHVLNALERAGCAPRPSGGRWVARCPAHDDRVPSLSVAEGRDGRVLLRCWAGCDTAAVLKALGLSWYNLFDTPRSPRRP